MPDGRKVHLRMGHREDVEVDVQRGQSDMVVERFGADTLASLRDVPRSGGAIQTLGYRMASTRSPFSRNCGQPSKAMNSRYQMQNPTAKS